MNPRNTNSNRKTTLIQRRNIEEETERLGETIEDMVEKLNLKTTNFLANKIGFSNEETTKQLKQVNLTVVLNKRDKVLKTMKKNLEESSAASH